MADTPHVVHSFAEAYLYLLASPCPACKRTGRTSTGPWPEDQHDPHQALCVNVRCSACGQFFDEQFQLSGTNLGNGDGQSRTINPTSERSRVIDAVQWLNLAALLMNSATTTDEPGHARQLKIEAAECIAEALKFYDDDENDLPPPGAFFCEESRARFRDFPGELSRQRLINLIARLPKAIASASTGVHSRPVGIRRWCVQEDQTK